MATMNTTLKLLTLFLTLSSTQAMSEKLSMEQAANEFSSEGAECVAYYTIAVQCFSDKLSQDNRKAFDQGLKTAFTAAEIGGKNAGMSDEAIKARLMLAMNNQMDDIQKNCVNIPILLNRYAKSCQSFVDHPVDRLQYLMKYGK